MSNNLDLPDFLTKPGHTERYDENSRHYDKLRELVQGTDEDDAKVVCELLAEKYPLIMFEALEERHNALIGINNKAKELLNSLGGLE